MPPAAVEVVAPDFSTIDRLSLSPGEQKSVDVPSEGSFLRVYLGSGEIVTLKDPGNLDRTISLSDLAGRRMRSTYDPSARLRRRNRRDVQWRAGEPVVERGAKAIVAKEAHVTLEGDLGIHLVDDFNVPESGEIGEENTAVVFNPSGSPGRYILALQVQDARVRVRLPGSATEITVRSNELDDGQRVASIRVKTSSAHADTISGYLYRGDLYAASSMSDWAEKAEDLLQDKTADVFAAAVGAYRLLRLRNIDLLHEWTQNLMLLTPITDAVVIRAWHLIYQRADEQRIRELFVRALNGPLPIFTEGLRLLSDGARLLGKESEMAVTRLNRHARRALSRSPFTATLDEDVTALPTGWDIDIDYAPPV